MFELELHREFKVLCASFLFDVNLVLVDSFIGSPVDTLVGANRVIGRRFVQDHIFAELSQGDLEPWLLACRTSIFEQVILAQHGRVGRL